MEGDGNEVDPQEGPAQNEDIVGNGEENIQQDDPNPEVVEGNNAEDDNEVAPEAEEEEVFVDCKEPPIKQKEKKPAPWTHPNGKVKLPNLPVPTFSAHHKEDIDVFFDQLENISYIYGWSDRLTLETALASFKANAHAWAMELERDQKRDYDKFKSLAIETFKKSVPSWLRSKKLMEVQQRPGQDSQDFAAALRRVQLTLQAPSEAMLSAYLCGLSEKLAQMVAIHDPQTFEEAARMAKKFEAIVSSSSDRNRQQLQHRDNHFRSNPPRDSSQCRNDRQSYNQTRGNWQGNYPAVNEVQRGDNRQGDRHPSAEHNKSAYCSFHGQCAHTTADCRQIKRQQGQRNLNEGRAPAPTAGSGPKGWPSTRYNRPTKSQ